MGTRTKCNVLSFAVADESVGSNTLNLRPDLARAGFELHLSHRCDYNV